MGVLKVRNPQSFSENKTKSMRENKLHLEKKLKKLKIKKLKISTTFEMKKRNGIYNEIANGIKTGC